MKTQCSKQFDSDIVTRSISLVKNAIVLVTSLGWFESNPCPKFGRPHMHLERMLQRSSHLSAHVNSKKPGLSGFDVDAGDAVDAIEARIISFEWLPASARCNATLLKSSE